MFLPAAAENWNERGDDQRKSDEGEQNVRKKECKINRPNDTRRCEMGRFLTDVKMVNELRSEENGRGTNRGDHAGNVLPPEAAPDEPPAQGNENGAGGIERRIDRRQIRNCHGEPRA